VRLEVKQNTFDLNRNFPEFVAGGGLESAPEVTQSKNRPYTDQKMNIPTRTVPERGRFELLTLHVNQGLLEASRESRAPKVGALPSD